MNLQFIKELEEKCWLTVYCDLISFWFMKYLYCFIIIINCWFQILHYLVHEKLTIHIVHKPPYDAGYKLVICF
jgi:hypothetical protein